MLVYLAPPASTVHNSLCTVGNRKSGRGVNISLLSPGTSGQRLPVLWATPPILFSHFSILYSLFSILYSLFSVFCSLFSILCSLFSILLSLSLLSLHHLYIFLYLCCLCSPWQQRSSWDRQASSSETTAAAAMWWPARAAGRRHIQGQRDGPWHHWTSSTPSPWPDLQV